MIEAIEFLRVGDAVYAANWPMHIGVTQALIDCADPDQLVVGEGVLEFHCANGGALYEVLTVGDVWDCRWMEALA